MDQKEMQNRKWILITLMLGTLMASLDSSIVNVSLPVMSRQFHSSMDNIHWVVTAYMLSFCVFMPVTGFLKNRVGFFRLYVIALLVFTVGSLCCGLSRSLDGLILSRVLQALGGGAINPTVLSIISTVFPPKERGSAVGWWGIGALLGPALGPTVGGILTQQFGWPSIFFVNLPVCVLTVFLAWKYLRFLQPQPLQVVPFDRRGFIFLSVFVVSLQYALARVEKAGAVSVEVLGTFGAAVVAFMLFLRSERRSKNPIIRLSLFAGSVFPRTQLLTFVRAAALFGGLFMLPFLLQGFLGYSELQSGLLLLPGSAATAVMTPLAGKWADRHGSRNILVAALLVVSTSQFFIALIDKGTPLGLIIGVITVRGLGFGMLMTPLTTAVVNSVDLEDVTMASSTNSLIQQLSGSIGIVLLAIVYEHTLSSEKGLLPEVTRHVALQRSFWVSSFLVALGLIPAWGLPERQVKPEQGNLPMPEQHAAHTEAAA